MMKVKAARRLSPLEVIRRISEYQKHFNINDPEDYVARARRVTREEMSLLSEWRELLEAYQAYEEGGELDYVVEEDLVMDPQTIQRVLTKKRLELIATVGHTEFTSISHLARHLGREIKNTYEDLRILKKAGIVGLTKTRKNVQPKLLVDGISLLFR